MASPILHIKDSYYFEVPKFLWPPWHMSGKEDFTGSYETWLRLDSQFQLWEAHHFYDEYARLRDAPRPKEELITEYVQWKHNHAHAGKPFWRFLAEKADRSWYAKRAENKQFQNQWRDAIERTSGHEALTSFRRDPSPEWRWSSEKLAAYNQQLEGKILIPQPFGRLRNLYQKEDGWGPCLSRFMIIEVVVALLLWAIFSWLARNVRPGSPPRGPLWNLLETLVVFVRDEIARPVIGHHEPAVAVVPSPESLEHMPEPLHRLGAAPIDDQLDKLSGHSTGEHSAAAHKSQAPAHQPHEKGQEEREHAHDAEHHHDPRFDADRFVPLLLTIFFFVLCCNLSGLVPWAGAPTGEWGTTSAVAIITLATGVVFGMLRFGVLGYFGNQVPGMDLPIYMAIPIKPLILVIEVGGVLIKHAVLSIRLLANMVAGHIVLLSIMGLAFSLEGAASSWWPLTALISIFGSTLLMCLELFVAFLQAYIFTFLSALFIGAAMHSH